MGLGTPLLRIMDKRVWKRFSFAIVCLIVSACSSSPREDEQTGRGEDLAQLHCSSCHAVGRAGESPRPGAPPFRQLSRSYPVDSLEEALAEGISVGHPAMPQFEFAPEDVDALLRYLNSIQAPAHP